MSRPRIHAPLTRPTYADLERQLAEARGRIEAATVALSALPPRPGLWRLKRVLAILSKEGE